MAKIAVISFVMIIISLDVFTQERYSSVLFDEINTETVTYATKDGEALKMDIYIPQNDPDFERATLIYLHGGGFSTGTRDSEKIVEFCNRLAGYGYVVVSMSYRLSRKNKETGFGCDCPAEDKLNTFIGAIQDIQDASYFLVENREQFGINPQKLILAGSSAGAEAALNAAYQPPMCYGLDSGPVSYAGVISMAGAIPDTVVIYEESAIPSLFFHGTDDNLVPYATAPHRYCQKGQPGYLVLNGPHTIVQKLDKLHTPYWLHTTCGGAHEISDLPMTEYFDVITEFCQRFVIEGEKESVKTVVEGKQKGGVFGEYYFCNN
ncbi:MAG TPA: carboxylesterase [Prolixibacteraceae bacterium]|nr:carboxylesterase [Prolixibacteraceae bacterium]